MTSKNFLALFATILLVVFAAGPTWAQQGVPTVDGESGGCSVDLTAVNASGRPVAGAQIEVEVYYGFLGVRRLDLQVGTDSHGRARFAGLPDNADGVLYFQGTKDRLFGVAVHYLAAACHGRHYIYLGKPPATGNQFAKAQDSVQ